MTMGKTWGLPEPLHLWNGDNNSIALPGLMGGVCQSNEKSEVKRLCNL